MPQHHTYRKYLRYLETEKHKHLSRGSNKRKSEEMRQGDRKESLGKMALLGSNCDVVQNVTLKFSVEKTRSRSKSSKIKV